jgi:hypothetical protein
LILLSSDDFYTQRNNRLNPGESCMTTARVMYYRGNGIDFINPSYDQDDDFFYSCLNSESAKYMCVKKYQWSKGLNPNEVHGMYNSYLDLLVCGKRTGDFNTTLTFLDMINLVNAGKVVMTSGNFPTVNGHAVCIIGYNRGKLLIADPWGDYRDGYNTKSGYGVPMSESDFNEILRIRDGYAWGHVPY